jgi:CheY-like chemotaxis protein
MQARGSTQLSPGHATALIVEDSGTDRRLLQALLEQLGCHCDTAGDGQEGIRAALSGSYDFVFMDIQMPRMDGMAATRFIHANLGPRSPFIVAVSGSKTEGDRKKCSEAGMDYFMAKPVRRAALQALLED